MPKSRVRKRTDYTPPTDASPSAKKAKTAVPSPPWYAAVMCVVLLVGLAYVVVSYLAGDQLPVMQDLGVWNTAVGFGFMVVGLGMAVRWR